MAIRGKYKEKFEKSHGIGLGLHELLRGHVRAP
jgi:hypothetical protein